MTTPVLPPLAGGGGAGLPPLVIAQTSPHPPVVIRATLATGGGGVLPPDVPLAPMAAAPPAGGGGTMVPFFMRLAIPEPPGPPLAAWQRDVEGWAIARERQAHVQALWQYGELVVFALLWHIEDLAAGLVQRCYRCWSGQVSQPSAQSAELAIAAAYGQGNQYQCPVCYGTTLALPAGSTQYPGIRALLVRPAVLGEIDKAQARQARGIFDTASISAESTPDFRVRSGDFLFRSDGTRFQLRAPRRTTLRTGFATPWQASSAISYNLMSATLEDPLTVAYQIPPPPAQLAAMLGTYTRVPVFYEDSEIINGPLIPEEAPSPASSGSAQPGRAPDPGYVDTYTGNF